MREISEQMARYLIVSGAAGYWSLYANPPIEHDEQTVVWARGRWFLLPAEKLKVEFLGVAGVLAGRMKGAFNIRADENLEIVRWLKEDTGLLKNEERR